MAAPFAEPFEARAGASSPSDSFRPSGRSRSLLHTVSPEGFAREEPSGGPGSSRIHANPSAEPRSPFGVVPPVSTVPKVVPPTNPAELSPLEDPPPPCSPTGPPERFVPPGTTPLLPCLATGRGAPLATISSLRVSERVVVPGSPDVGDSRASSAKFFRGFVSGPLSPGFCPLGDSRPLKFLLIHDAWMLDAWMRGLSADGCVDAAVGAILPRPGAATGMRAARGCDGDEGKREVGWS